MGLPVLIYGKSGSGKSRSLKFFDEDEIVLLNTEKKELPFRKRFKKTGSSDDIGRIITTINQNPEKVFVIDDAGYIMTHLFMANHRNKKGNASFEMYDDIADTMYGLVKMVKTEVKDPEKIVYIIFHEDTDDFGVSRLRTIGKQLDRKVCLEGIGRTWSRAARVCGSADEWREDHPVSYAGIDGCGGQDCEDHGHGSLASIF